MMKGTFSLGLDAGSVTLKIAVLDAEGTLVFHAYRKHYSNPLRALAEAMRECVASLGEVDFSHAAVTGSARDLLSEVTGVRPVNEITAQAVAVHSLVPGVRTVIEIGGQDSKYVRLGDASRDGWPVILAQQMNDICAAGTGAFIEQQAQLMGIPVDEFGEVALRSGSPAVVAGRCAVFARTDIVHLRQEGAPVEDIAAGICRAVARNYMAQFGGGNSFEPIVAFQGGVAANAGVVKAFRELLGLGEDELVVTPYFTVTGALGTALIARRRGMAGARAVELLHRVESASRERSASAATASMPPLKRRRVSISTVKERRPVEGEGVFVGIDVGSTSTCVVVLGEDGSMLARSYTFNRRDIMESVNAALRDVRSVLGDVAGGLEVKGAGVTGSGRYLVAEYVGADVVRDEISAQAAAAVRMLPEVDTVIEIGGQDSKYIRISNGKVVDFEMNKVCAAGTGAFLQEQAVRLGDDISSFPSKAFESRAPVDMGSRCTVFMESDLVGHQQRGVSHEDLIAGLSYSIAKNYLEKVVCGKEIGDKILFLGGVAFNDAVVAAFREILGKEIIVPRFHEVSGALGAALVAAEAMDGRASRFRGFDGVEEEYDISSFRCSDCPNACRINRITTGGKTFTFGGACGKYEKRRRKKDLPDLFRERSRILASFLREVKGDGPVIGIPMAHLAYQYLPLWAVFFQELGCKVEVSGATSREVVEAGLRRTPLDNCFACKVMYGHIEALRRKGVDYVFLPSVIEFQRRVGDIPHNFTCPHVQAVPDLARRVFPSLRVISPVFLRFGGEDEWKTEMVKVGESLGFRRAEVEAAVAAAERAQHEFYERCEELGERLLASDPREPIVVVFGKPYTVADPSLNMNIADKLLDLGVIPVPYDCLPLSKQHLPPERYVDMVFEVGQDLLRAARITAERPGIHPVMVTAFSCTPDSFVVKFLQELFRDEAFLVLEVDEHTSDVGVVTRLEAFVNTIRRKDHRPSFEELSSPFRPFVPSSRYKAFRDKRWYVSSSYRSYRAIVAALRSVGIDAVSMPPHDRRTEQLGRRWCSGKECNPYLMEVGSVVKTSLMPDFDPSRAAFMLPSSDIACRISIFPTGLSLVLNRLGYPYIPVIAPRISMETDEFSSFLGMKFVRNVFRGMLAIDLLAKLLVRIRPYESEAGTADRAFERAVSVLCDGLERGRFHRALREAVGIMDAVETVSPPEGRPLIGILGDDYTRDSAFANNGIEKEIERMGGEVCHVTVWSGYLEFQMDMKPRNMMKKGRYLEGVFDAVKSAGGKAEAWLVKQAFGDRLRCFPEPLYSEMMKMVEGIMDARTDPVLIIAVARLLHLLDCGVDGIVNLVGFQCAIYSIFAAMLKDICEHRGGVPNLTLFCDFQQQVHQRNRLEAFMDQVNRHHGEAG